jgi:outer membrane protein insertion porin family
MPLLTALLWLAVSLEPTVRSVRIEAPSPERLSPYVDIRPGQPFDAEAVRRAVELLHATGEFEDVLVETNNGPEGIDVVFRTRPAPLLAGARVVGDRVLSASTLLKRARLRRGEPLWPARLERAGRDAALAFVAAGYLEAVVNVETQPGPGGTDLVFRVAAGPRARVAAVRVDISGGDLLPVLNDLIRPAVGAPYRKAEAERAAERMRKRLVAAGRWRATVEVRERYDPGRAGVDLAFAAAAGAVTNLEFVGTPVSRSLHNAVREIVRDGGARGDALEAGGERIENAFRRSGHRDVVVRSRFEKRASGEALVYEVRAGPAATAASVRIVGAEGVSPVLETRPEFPLEERFLDADVRRITRLLEDLGYAEVRVEADVPEGGGAVPVVFSTRLGPRTLVREVTVEGGPKDAAKDTPLPELRLRKGEPYRLRELASDRDAVLAACRNEGYLQAEVRPEIVFSEDRSEVDVRLVVELGRRTLVDHVVVAGLERTEDIVVRRELTFEEGQPLGLDRLLESQRRLSALGLFERVSMGELDPERTDRRDVVVSLREAPVTTLAYGVGYSEQDLLRASIEATRRNLFGMDRTLSAFARASFRGTRFLLSYREPYLLGRKRELYATAFWEEEDRVSFDFNRLGGVLQTARTVRGHLSLIGRYLFQKTRVYRIDVPIEELDRPFRNYTVSGPSASVVYDTRDDPLEPHRGRFLGTDLQLSLEPLGGDSFVKGFFQSASYKRLASRATLALSARLGLGRTIGSGEPLVLPLPERFFAGGDYGPRGYALDTAGPLRPGTNGELFPTGGNALVFGGAELRFDLGRRLTLGTFVDSGNVYLLVRDIDLRDLRYSAGLGLRYRTPLGPIRVDWGYKLNRRPEESASHFHFTIGNAF